jgi:hypothetical protein
MYRPIYFVFTCLLLFNDLLNSSDYIESNDNMINE